MSYELLPKHGKISCRDCFKTETGDETMPHSEWRMINDPGAWGSNNPEYLVLGFSKGATQAGIYKEGNFEDVAFAGMRSRLTQVLQAIGILRTSQTVDEKISDPESNIAFGSLIRCSVTRLDIRASEKEGRKVYSCTGPIISKSFLEIPEIIDSCATKFLVGLPASVKIVFFLGSADNYIKNCQLLIKKLFPTDFKRINQVAVRGNNRLWVHLSHPSGTNAHFNKWLTTDFGSGEKRILAMQAVQQAI